MKRLLFFFILLLTAVVGQAEDFEVGGIYYNITSAEELTVAVTYRGQYSTQYSIYSGSVVIPETVLYNGKTYRVTEIGEAAFASCRDMTSIIIPNSVTKIGESAFVACMGLVSISIPNSVTKIEGSTFANCYGLTSVTIPNSVTEIGEAAFYLCI